MSKKSVIKIPKFSGEKMEWKLWSKLMRARLQMLNLLELIEMKPGEILTIKDDQSKKEI